METALFGVPNLGIFIDLAILIGLLLLGVPAPFAFMAALSFLVYVYGFEVTAQLPTAFHKMKSLTLLALPFFIMLGGFMTVGGIADRLVAFADALVGRFRGGLGMVAVVACAMVGAIAGTCSAAVAALGGLVVPEMEKQGYSRGYATGLLAVSSVLGQLIPPSVPMILYGFITYQSVTACFLAGVGPGILTVIIYCIVNYFMVRNNTEIKVLPPIGVRAQTKQVGVALYKGFFSLMMPVILLGGIYGGIFTCTEAAAVALVYAIVVGLFIYRSLKLRDIGGIFATQSVTTGVVVLMVIFVLVLSRVMTMQNIPQGMIAMISEVTENYYVTLLMVNLFLILLGMIVDDFTGTLLAAPLLFPLMTHIGVHPIHFAAILGTNLGLGNVTPPTAPILYLAARIGNVSVDKMIKPALVFMVCGALPVVLVTTYWPDLSLFLPRLLMPRVMGVAG
ncbi:MAG TPA: TRAP transporter large permease [Dehalococcoidia bacterium]|nr:TRAP transporter large permease [Dehalococcoidia bacterium]HUV55841.1 TRAP transporter large permease [Dehalococcoidales bacterium]